MSVVVISCLALLDAFAALLRAVADHVHYGRRCRELQQRVIEAQRVLRLRGDLANEVAHEIKNPITAILCSAETLNLLIGEQLDEHNRKSLLYIKEYGDHLLRVVSDFLDVSRAETGNIKSRPEAVPVFEVTESIVGLLESVAIRKSVAVKAQTTNKELIAHVDPKHLKQIIFNLVHNAIKFTPERGEVQIIVKDKFPEAFLSIEVRDNGVGIPSEELDGLFDPYTHSEAKHVYRDTGTGLGLALCRALVELAGGMINARSEVGVGTSFEFTCPLYQEEDLVISEDLVPTQADLRASQPLKGQTFLVVDEDLGSRESVSRLIEAWGGMVDRVSMAVDAVEAIGRKDYTAVMIDDSVDGVYGCELARMIKRECRSEDTTIIVTTAEPIDPHARQESPADRYLAKPLNGEALLRSLICSGKYFISH